MTMKHSSEPPQDIHQKSPAGNTARNLDARCTLLTKAANGKPALYSQPRMWDRLCAMKKQGCA